MCSSDLCGGEQEYQFACQRIWQGFVDQRKAKGLNYVKGNARRKENTQEGMYENK